MDLKIKKKSKGLGIKPITSPKPLDSDFVLHPVNFSNISLINSTTDDESTRYLLPVLPKISKIDELDDHQEIKEKFLTPISHQNRSKTHSREFTSTIRHENLGQIFVTTELAGQEIPLAIKAQNHTQIPPKTSNSLRITLEDLTKTQKMKTIDTPQKENPFRNDFLKVKIPIKLQTASQIIDLNCKGTLNQAITTKIFERRTHEKARKIRFIALKHFSNFETLIKKRDHYLPNSTYPRPKSHVLKQREINTELDFKSNKEKRNINGFIRKGSINYNQTENMKMMNQTLKNKNKMVYNCDTKINCDNWENMLQF